MAKLNNSISDLELTSNKISATSINSAWTDTQYPSAKTLYKVNESFLTQLDNIHPVGSVLCMAENTNPSNLLGGTWELIDKDFACTQISITDTNWKNVNATLYGSGSCIDLYDNIITIRIALTITVSPTDSEFTVGKIDFPSLGLPETLYYGDLYIAGQGDGLQSRMCHSINNDGTIKIYDSLNLDGTHSARLDTMVITGHTTVSPADMPDRLCNKFYFKRTA
jgi:hypothetical protein